jgi:hypothetical protein
MLNSKLEFESISYCQVVSPLFLIGTSSWVVYLIRITTPINIENWSKSHLSQIQFFILMVRFSWFILFKMILSS